MSTTCPCRLTRRCAKRYLVSKITQSTTSFTTDKLQIISEKEVTKITKTIKIHAIDLVGISCGPVFELASAEWRTAVINYTGKNLIQS